MTARGDGVTGGGEPRMVPCAWCAQPTPWEEVPECAPCLTLMQLVAARRADAGEDVLRAVDKVRVVHEADVLRLAKRVGGYSPGAAVDVLAFWASLPREGSR